MSRTRTWFRSSSLAAALRVVALALLACLASLSFAAAFPASASAAQKPVWGFHSIWNWWCLKPSGERRGIAHTADCPAGQTKITPEDQIAASARAGTPTARLWLTWASVERRAPVRGADGSLARTYDWTVHDIRYRAMLERGIRPIIIVSDAPEWARPSDWRSYPCPSSCAYAPDPGYRSDWRAFNEAMMDRYPRALAVEVWNEANTARFSQPGSGPAGYAKLLRSAHLARKRSGYRGKLIIGGPAGHGADWLDGVYRHSERRWFDGVGAHPYPGSSPWGKSMVKKMEELRRVQRRHNDEKTKLWLTEVGVPSSTAHNQGRSLIKLYRKARRSGYVRAVIFYVLAEGNAQEAPYWDSYGVLRSDLSPKPAYCELARRLGGREAC